MKKKTYKIFNNDMFESIREGVLSRVAKDCNELYTAGKEVAIEVYELKAKRSRKQNSYYWAEVVPKWQLVYMDCCGVKYSLKQTHEFMKDDMIPDEGRSIIQNTKNGKFYEIASTTDLSIDGMKGYIDNLIHTADEFSKIEIRLPTPKEWEEIAERGF